MRPKHDQQVRVIASGIVLALLLHPFAYAQVPVPPQAPGNQSQTGGPAASQPDVADTATPPWAQPSGDQLPDSPGTVQSRLNQPQAMTPGPAPVDNDQSSNTGPTPSQQQSDLANAPGAQVPPASPQSKDQVPDSPSARQPAPSQADTQPSPQSQQQQSPHEPLGTAAAESVQTTGVAASRPAGAAVAPAKQRRVRSILIKVGALVGVGVAVATTMALSQGSPSKPPGSH